jgi:arylsulfatase A-like enzyme
MIDSARSRRPPNIVLLISHDLGCHIGPYGRAVEQSPHLLRFAAEGLRLDRHFVSSPGCSQSRSSLMTGRFPHANGQFGLANWGWKLNEDELLLPQALRDGGYHTALFGIWHLHEWTLSAFDTTSDDVSTLDSSPEGFAEIASHRAADWLRRQAGSRQPFYLHIGFWEVHRPFCGTGDANNGALVTDLSEVEVPDYLPDNEPTRREFAELQRSISVVDQGVARVLSALAKSGFADDTLVLFTADHGLPFQRAKGTLYDPGIHVACIARWPGRIVQGTSSRMLSSNVDIMPTLLEAAGLSIPPNVQGQSQLDAWCGHRVNGAERSAVFAEKTYHEHYDPIRCLRTEGFKYIRNFAERPMLVLPSDVYNSPSRRSMTDDEALWKHRPTEELYDLDADPSETHNLVDDPGYATVLQAARVRLTDWMELADDPLRHGPIRRPDNSDCAVRAVQCQD